MHSLVLMNLKMFTSFISKVGQKVTELALEVAVVVAVFDVVVTVLAVLVSEDESVFLPEDVFP